MNTSAAHTRRLGNLIECTHGNVEGIDGKISQDWIDLYKPHIDSEMPYRLMTPVYFDSNKRFPVIVSLHGEVAEGQITGNNCTTGTGLLLQSRDAPITYATYYVLARKPTVYGLQHTSGTSKMSLQNYRPLT